MLRSVFYNLFYKISKACFFLLAGRADIMFRLFWDINV